MSLQAVLNLLAEKNIRLSLENNQLKIDAAKGVVTPDILQQLRAHKDELLTWVRDRQAAMPINSAIEKRPEQQFSPLSFAQQRLWFIEQFSPSSTYHVPAALVIRGNLQLPLLEKVIAQLVERHEALRTQFIDIDGKAQQEVLSAVHLPIEIEQSAYSLDDKDALLQLAAQKLNQAFDLSQAPLCRLHLIELQDDAHLLLLNLHHIITDGLSNAILMQDIAAFYQAELEGKSADLNPLKVQYADYAYWQQNQLNADILNAKTHYWKEQLGGIESLELPTDFARPAQKSGRGSTHRFSLNSNLQTQVESLAKANQCTAFTVLLAAWQSLLFRYTQNSDICTGTPIAGRNQIELQEVVGFFVNTLALRNTVSAELSFSSLLKASHATWLDATEHQDVPFESIVDALNLPRDLSTTPVFQNAFSYNKGETQSRFDFAGLSIEALDFDTGTAKFDITLGVTDTANGYDCLLEYDSDIFLPSRMERMAQHFEILLQSALNTPERSIGKLALLTAKEQQLFTQEWHGSDVAFDKHIHLAAQIERFADKTPDALAIDYQGETLSYKQFDEKASQLAYWLNKQGFSKGDFLAIAIQRSPEYLISLFACLKAGGAYIPVDPAYPEDRIAYMLQDSQPKFIITQAEHLELIQSCTSITAFDFKQVSEQAQQEQAVWRTSNNNNNGEDLAYVMYTSGSTGQPKGVVMPQRGAARMGLNTNFTDIQAGQTVGHLCNIAFDASALEIWTGLLNGCCLLIVPPDVTLDAPRFDDLIQQKKPELLIMPPALFNIYVSHNPAVFKSVRHVISGGEAMDVQRVREVMTHGKPGHLINGYGPTENSCISTFHDIQTLADDESNIPLGISVVNNRCYILDGNLQLCPIGVAGELCVSGDGVAHGYLNDPEQTATAFVVSPFDGKPLYKTGDVCRWREDGTIEMLGRVDDQIKLRGFRIELGEINQQLGLLPWVKDSTVIVLNEGSNPYLAAYIVPSDSAVLASDDEQLNLINNCRKALGDILPQYMVPQAWAVLEQLPLTANGKVDKRALPEPTLNLSGEQEYIAPRNTLEQSIADIWQEVLQQNDISVLANFFEIGGHSLLATRVIAALRDQFTIDLAIRELFEHPTIADLALRIQLLQSQHSDLPPLVAQDRPEQLPLSFAQQRLWFIEQLSPGDTVYHMPIAVRLSGSLDVPALQKAYRALLERHEALRTQITHQQGLAQQEIIALDDSTDYLPLLTAEDNQTALEQRAAGFLLAPFNLAKAPLIRGQLLQLNNSDEFVLLLCMHHIISDGWSIDIVVRDLMALYAHYALSAPLQLPELPVQYTDFTLWQQQWLKDEVLQQQIDFWQAQLDDAEPIDLSLDFARPAQLDNSGAQTGITLSHDLSNKLRGLAQQEQSTLFMLGLAAFSLLMGRYSRSNDISIGTPVANRPQQGLQDLIGLFVNTLVMRNSWSGEESFSELLQTVKQNSLQAFAHQDIPFELLVDKLNIPRDLSQTPLFNVMFILQASSQSQQFNLELPGGLHATPLFEDNTQNTAKFDLTLNLVDTEQLMLVAEYRSSLFKAETIERLLEHFSLLLDAICHAPEQPIKELSFISPEFNPVISKDWGFNIDAQTPFIQLFEQQVAQTPDAIAFVHGNTQLSYKDLDQQANQLAQAFISKGIQASQRIAILLERSTEQMLALLAAMKAGCTYIPMDVEWPTERIQFVLEDSEAALLVCHSAHTDSIRLIGGTTQDADFLAESGVLSAGNEDKILDAAKAESVRQAASTLSSSLAAGDKADSALTIGAGIQEQNDTAEPSILPAGNEDKILNAAKATGPLYFVIDEESWTQHKSEQPSLPTAELAYILYTSGSTGNPKGVMLTQQGLSQYLLFAKQVYMPELAASVVSSTIVFDATITTLLTPLICGKTVIFTAQDDSEFTELSQLIFQNERALLIKITPAHLDYIAARFSGKSSHQPHQFIIGGEQLLTKQLNPWLNHLAPNAVYINEYGPTETVVGCCIQAISQEQNPYSDKAAVPIGLPIQDTRLYIVDDNLQAVAEGLSGELIIESPSVGLGYINLAEQSSDVFINRLPFIDTESRYYRSGDLVRRLADGNIEYLGRLDHQVKIRGFRIELDEIEKQLIRINGVEDAAVIVKDSDGDKRLVAFYIAAENSGISSAIIQQALKDVLPDYMLPSAFIAIDSMPITNNGKRDIKALQTIPVQFSSKVYVAPETELQQQLASIWQQHLPVEQVGIHDNFFDLGGHSLLAVKVIADASQLLEQELSVRVLFEQPTIAELARAIETQEKQALLPPIEGRAQADEAPLSFAQQRLWFIEQLAPNSVTYHVPAAFVLQGDIDVDLLQQALDQLVQRHEALRTAFVGNGQHAKQVILDDVQLLIEQQDSSYSLQDTDSLLALAEKILLQPFDLSQAPLCRMHLIRLVSDQPSYILLFNLHHIITDGISSQILMADMAKLYFALKNNIEADLAPLAIQYADFAEWQQTVFSAERLAEKTLYWKEKLHGIEALELPTDFARPAQKSGRGQTLHFNLPPHLQAQVDNLAKSLNTTAFVVLMAAWQSLLHRYTQSDDICSGTPVAGRNRAELQNVVGFFVNTLALRNDLSGKPSIKELIQRSHLTWLDASDNEDVPFESVVDALNIPRDLSSTPVFQNVFSYQKADTQQTIDLGDLSIKPLDIDTKTAKFDISLAITDQAQGYSCSLEYDSDIFLPSRMERMAEHFEILLSAALATPDKAISELPLLTAHEQQLFTQEWLGKSYSFDKSTHLAAQVEQWVERAPDALAIEYQGQRLSYKQLDEKASQLAYYLQKQGLQRNDFVAIAIQRSPEFLISLYAVIKAGGAYIPLDPSNPAERLAYMLEDSQPKLVITLDAHLASIQAHRADILSFEQASLLSQSESNIWRTHKDNNQGEDLAYMIYTSGSTGQPKGVVMPQRGAARLGLTTSFVDIQAGDTVAFQNNISFDATAFEIWVALLNGCTLSIIEQDILLDPELYRTQIQSRQIDVMVLTTALFNLYSAFDANMFAGVKSLSIGGEALDVKFIQQVLDAKKPRYLVNGYGPTENACFSVRHNIEQLDAGALTVPLGHPVDNGQCYILDANLQLAPIGVAGELCVSGDGVAHGYLNDPEQTAAAFVVSPFDGKPLYKTGDVCRWREDGTIEMLGRVDDQIKLRGFRIELGEINQQLGLLPWVKDSAVIVQNEGNNPYLAAYIVPADLTVLASDDEQLNAINQCRKALGDILPQYMVPQAWALLEKLPLTANGKVDKRALPEPTLNLSGEQEYIAPRNALEQSIAEVWQDVLQQNDISVVANFFEIGGHSLLATRVIAALRDQFTIDLAIRELFEHPTIADLALRIQLLQSQHNDLPPLVAQDRPEQLPLSFAQQRLWFIEQLSPGDTVYHMPIAVRLTGGLDVPALQKAYRALLERHEALRTQITHQQGLAQQEIIALDDSTDYLPLLTVEDNQTALEQRAAGFLLAPFNLAKAPLIRGQLLQLENTSSTFDNSSNNEFVLLLCMHHIISDGWSIDIVVRDLMALYAHYALSAPLQLPELPVQYADFTLWQQQWLKDEVLQQQIDFWQAHLDDAEPIDLPLDFARPAQLDNSGAQIGITLSHELSNKLRGLAQQEQSTLFMLGLAAFSLLMGRYSRSNDISIGTPVANRPQQGLQDLIGLFVNTLVMRNSWSGEESFSELLQTVKQNSLQAFAHQDIPFELLVDKLNIPRDLSQTPLFNVMFILQASSQSQQFNLELPGGLHAAPLFEDNTQNTAKFDLTLNLVDTEQLMLVAEYRSSLFKAETIERLLEHFTLLLEAICKAPEQPVKKLNFISEQEKLILQQWNDTAFDYPTYDSIQQIIEQQVIKTPDAIAVSDEQRSLSYQELNDEANRLAHYLINHYSTPQGIVGVCLHRSVDMSIALLATIKAGAAYLPMDPELPAERLAFMADDANAALILSNTTSAEAVDFNVIDKPVLLLNNNSVWQSESSHNPTGITQPSDAFNVIYTSGSTGNPKGVIVPHRGIINRLLWMQNAYPIDSSDNVFQKTPYNFDVSVWELFWPLMQGSHLHYAKPDGHKDPAYLRDYIIQHNISTIHFVPSMLGVFLQAENIEQCRSLRQVFCSGEALQKEHVRLFLQRLPHAQLHNLYGPTEASVDVSYFHCVDADSYTSIPIGKPIHNTQLYVLDEALNPLPIGVAGELHIGGIGLAHGYLNLPEMTASTFIPSPFIDGQIIYKTGDIARYLADGNIEYLGRVDHQIKIRGQRLELGEIESQLQNLADVKEAIVSTWSHDGRAENTQLVAYLLSDKEISLATVKLSLSQHLPSYMIPSHVICLNEWPLSSNGKLNRRALPKPEYQAQEAYTAPETALQQQLANIWQQHLPVEQVGIHDNFFDLGGHSLLAVRVLADINNSLNLNLPVKVLFEQPTIEQLASAIESGLGQANLPPITAIKRSEAIPLSFSQQRLWFLAQLDKNSIAYNMPLALRLKGNLNIQALEQAFNALFERQEALRSQFIAIDGEPHVYLIPKLNFVLEVENIQANQLDEYRRQHANQPFDLANEQLLKAKLLQIDSHNFVLLLNIHHIISDGLSLQVLIKDLASFYAHYAKGMPLFLPELEVQYADYAFWQRNHLQGEALQQQIDFWKRTLKGAPTLLPLPLDKPRPALQRFVGEELQLSIEQDLIEDLRQIASDNGSTLFMLMMAALQWLLAKYSRSHDICVGIPLAGRSQKGTEDLIGFFINALIIRGDVQGNISFAEFLQQIKDRSLAAFAHEHIPIDMMLNELGIERNLAYTPIVQCALNMMTQDASTLPDGINALDDLHIEPIRSDSVVARFDLQFNILDIAGDCGFSIDFNSDIFKRSSIERMGQHFIQLLESLRDNIDQRFYSLQLDMPAPPTGYKKIMPLSLMQRDMYLASLARPETLEHSMGYALEFPFALDESSWKQAVNNFSSQCEAYHSRIISHTKPWQDIAYLAVQTQPEFNYQFLDWSKDNLGPEQIQSRLAALVFHEYDIDIDSPISHRLIKINEQHYWATLAAHHLFTDGYSLLAQIIEACKAYDQLCKGKPHQYSIDNNYDVYVANNLASFDTPETINYWQQEFKSVESLQAETSDIDEQALKKLALPQQHLIAVKKFCRSQRITPALYFKLLYSLLITQYTRAEDSFAMIEFSSGLHRETQNSFGCFFYTHPSVVNTHLIKGDLASAIKHLREQQRSAKPYLGISRLQQAKLMQYSPLNFSYNYLLMTHHFDIANTTIEASRYTPNAEQTVDLRIHEDKDQLTLWLAFNRQDFDDKQFLERMVSLSQQIVEQDCYQLSSLNYLLANEQIDLQGEQTDTSTQHLLHELIQQQVVKTPDATAVQYGNAAISYQELDKQSNQLAHYLIKQGLEKGDKVGIYLGRQPELHIALLAVIKAGGCYIPMDTSYPQERLQHMVQDADMRFVLSYGESANNLGKNNIDLSTLDFSQLPATQPMVNINDNDLLYMIYTSGSTGLPKAAAVTHKNFANLMDWYGKEYGFNSSDKTLIISALGFDLTQKNLYAMLCVGGTVVLPDTKHYDIHRYQDLIATHRITRLNCAPSAFYPLIEFAQDSFAQLASLKTVLFGGEPIQLKMLSPWIHSHGFNCDIVNMYGPTECTDIATAYTAKAEQLKSFSDNHTIVLGAPIQNVQLWIVNEQLQAVPKGLVGELCISGVSVGAGYWQRDDLNQESFVEIDGIRAYKTGDLVKFNEQGELIYIGRKDFQVKLHGLRIELGEIESALNAHEAIQDSLVLVENEQLLAFVKADQAFDSDELNQQLQEKLPSYMVPQALITVADWPLTPNGKIDRKALLLLDRPEQHRDIVEPRTVTEKELARMWQEVLGNPVGVHDNFFNAGGDSLSAVRLIANIELHFEIKIPVSSLFNAQTIAQLAQVIEQKSGIWSPLVPIQPQGDKTPIFAIHALGGMVMSYKPLSQHLGDDQPFYGIQALGFEEGQQPFDKLNEIVAYYTAAIKQQQPKGPYRLIGHSFGGLLALEVARQLTAIGDYVEQLVVIDTHMPVRYMDSFVDDAMMLKVFAEHNFGVVDVPLKALRKLPKEQMVDIVAEQFKGQVSAEFIHRALDIIKGFKQMMMGYIPEPLDMPITLVRPEEAQKASLGRRAISFVIGQDRETLGWDKVTQDLQVNYVPGNHYSMLNQQELVDFIRKTSS